MHGNTRPTRVPQRFQEREIAQAFLFLKSCFVDFEETIDALKKLPNDKFAVSAARALEMASENNIEVAKKYIAKLNEKIARQFKLADSQDEQTLSESQPPLSKMTKLQMRDSQNMKNKNFDMLDDELDRYCELGELCKTEFEISMKEKKIPKRMWRYQFWVAKEKEFPLLSNIGKAVAQLLLITSKKKI